MIKPIDIAISSYFKRKKYFENYLKICKKIKNVVKKIVKDKNLKVIVFGSVVKKTYTPLSDLDILIVSDKIKRNKYAKIRVKIKESLRDFGAPIEFHFTNNEVFEKWYKRFLDKYVEV
jgi:predicted nucleotidyltransferase